MASTGRMLWIDRMRGLVMVLMAVDHAGAAFDAGHFVTDSAGMWRPGTSIPAAAFLTRWVTHVCAPTFVFLAGTALALSRARRGATSSRAATRRADAWMAGRGLFLIALEPLVLSPLQWLIDPPRFVLQVLYAIGASMIVMVPLRRLPPALLVACALAILVGYEAVVFSLFGGITFGPPDWGALLLAPKVWMAADGVTMRAVIVYPLLPWLAMMMLGWGFGCALARAPDRAGARLLQWGLGGLAAFALVRGLNGYGNMGLLRDGDSILQWLHVSKYPPSFTFAALTLGLMALGLLGFRRWQRDQPEGTGGDANGLLAVLGQTALFFYLLHFVVLFSVAKATGLVHGAGLVTTWVAAAGVCVALYPACRAYRSYKRRHPNGWTRLV